MFVGNVIMYVFIVGFYGAEFNFLGLIFCVIVHPFLESGSRPLGTFRAKNAPQNSHFDKRDPFLALTFD